MDHPDPFTQDIANYWQGTRSNLYELLFIHTLYFISETFTCGSSGYGSLSLVSEDAEALKKPTAYLGYQYVRKVECGETWMHKVEKQVNCKNLKISFY